MIKKCLILFLSFVVCKHTWAQKDTTSKDPVLNADINYDELFNELDDFLDSLLKPRSYSVINVAVGSNFFDYSSEVELKNKRQFIVSPSYSYYSKSGFGFSGAANIVKNNNQFNPYQYLATLSYDYIKNINFVSGISATHYFTKDSLDFYTSPLKNELYAYFSYRRLWLKPTASASYGWGSKQSVEERQDYITALRLRNGYTTVTTTESISDLNATLSLRHDFYWLNLFTSKDFVRFTPLLSFTSGTQNFGFNQTSNSYRSQLIIGKNNLYRAENSNLDNKIKFQPLSVAAALKSELSVGKFFVQPQVVFNYYIPAKSNNLATLFSVNTGLFFNGV